MLQYIFHVEIVVTNRITHGDVNVKKKVFQTKKAMAKKVTNVEVHAEDEEHEEKFIGDLDVSVDLIDDGLYLGNLATAHDSKTLERLAITHILTVDVVPLPRTILSRPLLTFKFVKLADVPKEDLITHLPPAIEFIQQAIAKGGTVLVHCYFGVSRSAAVVIAYIMQKYQLCYEEALTLVRSKRRFAHPNVGFEAQLRLFGHMGYGLNRDDPRFKQYRLRMAGQKIKQVKILPQQFADLIKPDPGLARERPHPLVYRCKRCRRVLATQRNLIPHLPKQVKIELAKKGLRPPPSKLTGLSCSENGQILIDKLKSLACQILDPGPGQKTEDSGLKTEDSGQKTEDPGQENEDQRRGSQEQESQSSSSDSQGQSHSASNDGGPSQVDDYHSSLVDGSVTRADAAEACRLMWFVEPVAWMRDVGREPHGKLHCPKCNTKVGSFSWVMGCKCPCGQKVAPAFYLVPSKVEWSNIVQNIQTTV